MSASLFGHLNTNHCIGFREVPELVWAQKLCWESNPIVHLAAFPLQWLSYPSSSLISILSCLRLTYPQNLRQRFVESEGSLCCSEIPTTGLFFFWRNSPQWARAFSFTRFLDHKQRSTTVDRTPLYEWSAHHRDLYLTPCKTHNRTTSMYPAGFEPTIPATERPHTHALDCAATGVGTMDLTLSNMNPLHILPSVFFF